MHRIRIPYKLLLQCQKDDTLKELSVFIGLKYYYASSHLHSTSNDKLTSLPVCGKTKAREAIKTFKRWGWVEESKKGLRFKSFKDISENSVRSFIIEPRSLNCKTIERGLYQVLIENKIRQYEYALTAYHYSKSLKKDEAAKSLKMYKKIHHIPSEWEDRGVCISYQGWGKLLNLSPTSSYRVIKRLQLQGVLTVRGNAVLTDIPAHARDMIDVKGVFKVASDGYLYQQLPNSYFLSVNLISKQG